MQNQLLLDIPVKTTEVHCFTSESWQKCCLNNCFLTCTVVSILNTHQTAFYTGNRTIAYLLPIFTIEDEQIVLMEKSSQTNKLSDVQTVQTNFLTNKLSDICPPETIFPRRFAHQDKQVNDSTT